MYYRLYDTQCNRYMATGCNTRSKKELVEHYLSYKSVDFEEEDILHYSKLPIKELITMIESDEFEIEKSKTKFEELN